MFLLLYYSQLRTLLTISILNMCISCSHLCSNLMYAAFPPPYPPDRELFPNQHKVLSHCWFSVGLATHGGGPALNQYRSDDNLPYDTLQI